MYTFKKSQLEDLFSHHQILHWVHSTLQAVQLDFMVWTVNWAGAEKFGLDSIKVFVLVNGK